MANVADPSPKVEGPYIPQYESLIEQIAAKYKIDPAILRTIVWQESRGNAHAEGDSGHSWGLVQIYLPAHPDVSKQQALNPQFAIDWAARNAAAYLHAHPKAGVIGAILNHNSPRAAYVYATTGNLALADKYTGTGHYGAEAQGYLQHGNGYTPTNLPGPPAGDYPGHSGTKDYSAIPAAGQPTVTPNEVLSAGGGSTGGDVGAATSMSTTAAPGPDAPPEKGVTDYSAHDLAQQYGFADAFFSLDSSLQNLISQAVENQWTAQRFQAELKNTAWFKSHTANQRQWLALQTSDKAEADRRIADMKSQVQQHATQLGVALDDKLAGSIALDMLYKGQDQSEIDHRIAMAVHTPQDGSEYDKGALGTATSQMRQYASQMGVTVADAYINKQALNEARGMSTRQDFQSYVNGMAKSAYPGLSSYIDNGQTVQSIAAPYISSYASLLELDPSGVQLSDPGIQKALQYRDPSSGQVGLMPLWQAQEQWRSDPRYWQTEQARNLTLDVVSNLGKKWGLVA